MGQGSGGGMGSGKARGKTMRTAVPAMPMPLAILCCVLNFLVPGLGNVYVNRVYYIGIFVCNKRAHGPWPFKYLGVNLAKQNCLEINVTLTQINLHTQFHAFKNVIDCIGWRFNARFTQIIPLPPQFGMAYLTSRYLGNIHYSGFGIILNCTRSFEKDRFCLADSHPAACKFQNFIV